MADTSTLDDHGDDWNAGDLDALRSLRAQGVTIPAIAQRLGRTPSGVTSKLYRLRSQGVDLPKGGQ